MTLLSLLENKGLRYRKVGSRYTGPCPKCGGSETTTRFVTQADSDTGKCFSCGWHCDSIGYLREIEGLTCKQAHAELGRECDKTDCPAFEKCRGVKTRKTDNATAQPARQDKKGLTPAESIEPAATWQEKAGKLVQWAHHCLLNTPAQMEYLSGRGLGHDAVIKYRLGYIPEDLYRPRADWGLPEELKENGQPKKLWIPRGIVIPFADPAGRIHRIRIRKEIVRSTDDLRYYWLPGSGNDLVILSPGRRASILIESDLDSLLVDHLAGDVVSTIPLGTCSARPKANTIQQLDSSAVILVALDTDPAGEKNWQWWQENYPQSSRLTVTAGKDPGEAWQQGQDLRAWVLSGLPISLHPPKRQPAQEQAEKPAMPAPLVHTIKAKDGREVNITDDPAEYARLSAEGKIVFNSREIALVKQSGLGPKKAGKIIDAKLQIGRVFGEVVIEELIKEVVDHESI